MTMDRLQLVIAGWICTCFIIVLSGCGTIPTHRTDIRTHRTDVRNLPDEVKEKLSIGDTQQKVRSILDAPLVDARSLGVEVYRQTGRDIDIDFSGVPLPKSVPGQKVIAVVLVAYDEHDVVEEIASNLWIPGYSVDFWITAGGYSFANIYDTEPETLLAPAITYEEFVGLATTEGECALVLLKGECPMEEISLDKSPIADLSPGGGYCNFDSEWVRREHNYYGAFIRRNITPGSHRLNIRQKTKHGNFETVFECEPGETVYAELEASNTVPDFWHGVRLEGAISISKKPTKNVLDMGMLLPIIWHRGKWYGSPNSPTEGIQ